MFRIPLTQLITKDISSKKTWLQVVKRARKLHEGDAYVEDVFDTNKALMKWIGLEDV